MKDLSSPMLSALNDRTTHLCRIWRLQLKNGTEHRFTDLDRNVRFDGEEYLTNPGIRVSSVSHTLNGTSSNASITARAGADFVTMLEARTGALDGAIFELYVLDWRDPDQYGLIDLFAGSVAEVRYNDKNRLEIELNGNLGANLDGKRIIGETYQRLCRARFGDAKCKFNIETVKFAFAVNTVSDSRAEYSFVSTDFLTTHPGITNDQFKMGHIEWVTGDNVGFTDEIKTNVASEGRIILAVSPRRKIIVGDVGYAYQGCDFTVTMCGPRYNNLLNYRGEPYAHPQGRADPGTPPPPTSDEPPNTGAQPIPLPN